MIKKMSINIHPSLPEYQGVCGVSRALYDGKKEYGSTAHIIEDSVDTGRIIKVMRFPIHDDTCESLDIGAKNNSLILLEEILQDIANGKTDWQCDENWSNNRMTRKQFEEFITLPIDISKEELERMIRAVKHPEHPGPFIKLHGYKFTLWKEPQ
jgi:methionyl-tRNA formyltransferase